MIEINGLTKSYGEKTVFEALSFRIEENVCTVFSGPSGIGKTTLMRCIAGLEKPDAGTVTGANGRKASFVFQENRLIGHISALNNILCVAPDRERAEYYLGRVGLGQEADKKADELSGGMKRRLALARALAFGGDVWYLDEPLRELDEKTEEEMLLLLKEELSGKTALLITHESAHAQALAQRTLRFGGTPMQLLR